MIAESFTVFSADGHYRDCGHKHKTIEAAQKCLDTLYKRNPVAWNTAHIEDNQGNYRDTVFCPKQYRAK